MLHQEAATREPVFAGMFEEIGREECTTRTWHYALNDYRSERRLMHRITIEGVALEGA